MNAASRCPSRSVLALFRNGELTADEMKAIAIHVQDCVVCGAVAPTRRRARAIPWIMLATIAVAVFAVWHALPPTDPPSPFDVLGEAAPEAGIRPIEARLTGARIWVPAASRSKTSSAGGPELRLRSAGLSVLESVEGNSSPEGRHAAGVARLYAGDAEKAATILELVAAETRSPRVWSDLAAAHYDAAIRSDDSARLLKALVAADAALSADAAMPEALFNRALILERLGLRDQARDAWTRYLAVERASEWAAEARQHVRALAPVEPFKDFLAKNYDRLATDAAFARQTARTRPNETRTWGETRILGNWADAQLAGDSAGAAKHLRLARDLGGELARFRGDHMLEFAVAAIDRADDVARTELARGHIAFREAQSWYRQNHAATAHRLFVQGEQSLQRGGSPVALLARYFRANTAFDLGRIADACADHEHLLRTAPPEFPAHRAQLQWQLGRAYLLASRWGEAIDTLTASIEGFDRLGEAPYAAAVREILAEAYDRIGDPDAAWPVRMASLRQLGLQKTPRLKIMVASMTKAALLRRSWSEAASLLQLELELAGYGSPADRVEMLLLRAQLHTQLQDLAAAKDDLVEARAAIERLDDPALSTVLVASAIEIDGTLAASPDESIRLLTSAIDLHRARGRRFLLPDALLARGRAHARGGHAAEAGQDFETAITELEQGRNSLPSGESRLGFFHTAEDLFDEAILHALSLGDTKAAFGYAERARARQLLDALGRTSPTFDGGEVAPDAAIVAYVTMEDRLVLFAVDRSGVVAREHWIDRATLARQVQAFSQAVRAGRGPEIRSLGAALHHALIAPLHTILETKRTLILVPDDTLATVSFAALIDSSGRHLIQRHNVFVVPSAAVYTQLAKRRRVVPGDPRILIVANPIAESGEESLPAAEIEARRIGRLYRNALTLARGEATHAAFRREAPAARFIHFAGHAAAGKGAATALLLTHVRGESWRADAKSIASMRLDRTQMVVLAGCSTARGELRAGEGVLSLARSFIAAGVPTVVATIEPIGDEQAAEFFPRFHELLSGGLTPAEALRAVQIEWIERPGAPRWAWAAVQLIGS